MKRVFVGAILVARWSIGLLRESGWVLLDRQEGGALEARIRAALEADGDARITDLHLWAIAPGARAAIVALDAAAPRPLQEYKSLLSDCGPLAHLTLEVERRGTAP